MRDSARAVGQAALSPRRLVAQLDRRDDAGEVLVGLLHHRVEARDERRPGVAELVAELGELRVPHVEGDLRRLVEPAVGLLEQGVALLHDPIELESQGVVLERQRHERVVEEAAPLAGPLLHERQVVGREHGHPHHAEQVAGARQLLAVDQHPVAARAVELGLDQHLATVVVEHRRPDDRRVGADPDQRVGRGAAEAVERGQVRERLGEVGLALAVVADDGGGARRELERRRDVVAEVDEVEPGDDHRGPDEQDRVEQDRDEQDGTTDARACRGGSGRRRGRSRDADRHQQVQVVVGPTPRRTAGFSASIVDSVTSSDDTASTPAAR